MDIIKCQRASRSSSSSASISSSNYYSQHATNSHMAESCLVDIMDQLWFHRLILSPEIPQPPPPTAASSPEEPLSNSSSVTQVISEDNSSVITNNQDDQCQEEINGRPKKLQISRSENKTSTWVESSPSPLTRRRRRPHYLPGERRRLSKTMSCKSLCELELEEVKGFMDLGFDFEKGPLDKRMMSVIPGLQRLELNNSGKNSTKSENAGENEEDEGEVKKEVVRPYLSEAWLVRGPESPLLNLTIPSASTSEDMKKNLKYWARTVASTVQLESY